MEAPINQVQNLPLNLAACLGIWDALQQLKEAPEEEKAEILEHIATVVLMSAPTAEA